MCSIPFSLKEQPSDKIVDQVGDANRDVNQGERDVQNFDQGMQSSYDQGESQGYSGN
jgi:hypothetical protein